jgi:hypothetical protein
MTQAIDVKPLVIPDRESLVVDGVAGDALLHLLNDLNNRLKVIAGYQEPVIPDPPDTTGRLIAGTPLVQNPLSLGTTTTQAHGLSAIPAYIESELECLTAEAGYSVGDVISDGGFILNMSITKDATNIVAVTQAAMGVTSKSGHAVFSITAANWKMTLTPYARST